MAIAVIKGRATCRSAVHLQIKKNGRHRYSGGHQEVCSRKEADGGLVNVAVQRAADDRYDVFADAGHCGYLACKKKKNVSEVKETCKRRLSITEFFGRYDFADDRFHGYDRRPLQTVHRDTWKQPV